MEQRLIKFKRYFADKFVGWEQWTERGWMYSEDGKMWNFEPKYASSIKVQFCGLLDKNGVEIYESDKLKWENGDYGIVVWNGDEDMARWLVGSAMISTPTIEWSKAEVIGNIYENKRK